MIYFVLASALVFIPTLSTFVDAFHLPQLAYLSVLGAICAWRIQGVPLLRPWLFYLGAVAFSGLVAPNPGMFLSRFSLDLIGGVFFWYFAQVPNLDTRKIGWTTSVIALGVVTFYSVGWIREVERPAGVIAIAASLLPGQWWVLGLPALGGLKRRAAFLALLFATVGVQFGRLACLTAILWSLLGVLYIGPPDFAGRIDTWTAGLQIAREHPFVGVGRGNMPIFLYSHSPSIPYHHAKWVFEFTDNDYLDLLLESGPGSVAAYVWLLWSLFHLRPQGTWQRSLYVSLLTVPIRSLFHSVLLSPAEVAWFWSLAGIYWRLHENETGMLGPSRPLHYP